MRQKSYSQNGFPALTQDWLGLTCVTKNELRNRHGSIPEGTLVRIIVARSDRPRCQVRIATVPALRDHGNDQWCALV